MAKTRYVAPEITTLVPRPEQQQIIDANMAAISIIGRPLWVSGRGAGKSTTRAMIAQALLDQEDYPMYEVRPIVRRDDA